MSTFCSDPPPTEFRKHLVQDEKGYHSFSRPNSLLFGSEDPKSFAMFTPSLVRMILHLLDKLQLVPGVDTTRESDQVVDTENDMFVPRPTRIETIVRALRLNKVLFTLQIDFAISAI